MSEPIRSAGSTARGAAQSLRNRIRYRFDRLLSKGTWAVLLWLGAITFFAVLLSAILLTISSVTFTGEGTPSFPEEFWQSLLRVIDPGTMASDVGIGRRLLALVVTLTGLLIAGTLIGLIAAGVEQRVEGMRRGRSIVVESDHYVVLGWSDRSRVVIDQLTKADPGAVIVVLANRDASEMDEELRPALDPALGQRLIFRSGDPRLASSLALANVDEAKAVIVLAPGAADGADVVTMVLTLGQVIGFERVPIVAEVAADLAREKLLRATGPHLHPIIVAEAAARTAALVLRQPGLSEVVEELVDAATAGVHVAEVPELLGSTFSDAVFGLDAARPIGLIDGEGALRINPPPDTMIVDGVRVVAIAADPAAIVCGSPRAAPARLDPVHLAIERVAMRLLFVGWSGLAPRLLAEFDRFAAAGSTALVLVDDTVLAPDDVTVPATTHFAVERRVGTDPAMTMRDGDFTSIVLLAYDGIGADEADGRTLLDLALVTGQLAGTALETQLLVQLIDADRAPLAGMAGLNGFIISDAVGSRLIAQFATSPELQPVFRALYDPDRPSLHLLGWETLGISAPATFADVVSATAAIGVVAIGFLTPSDRGRRAVLNPALSANIEASDQIVVVG